MTLIETKEKEIPELRGLMDEYVRITLYVRKYYSMGYIDPLLLNDRKVTLHNKILSLLGCKQPDKRLSCGECRLCALVRFASWAEDHYTEMAVEQTVF